MAKSATIVSASLFNNRSTGQVSAWFKFDNGDSNMMNLKIAQSNLDAALMQEDSDLTLLEGCEVSYDSHPTKAGDAWIDDAGVTLTGDKAGVYTKDNPLRIINFVVDYTEAKQQNRELAAIAKAYAKRKMATQERIAAAKAALALVTPTPTLVPVPAGESSNGAS